MLASDMTTNQRLSELAALHNISAEMLAKLLLVSKRTVERWLLGQRHCPPGVVVLLELTIKQIEKEAS